MLFSAPTFLFLFLPGVLTVYWLLPRNMPLRNAVLLLASLFFYAWGEAQYVLLLGLSIACNYGFGLAVNGARGRPRARWVLGGAVAANLALLGSYKYAEAGFAGLDWALHVLGQPAIFRGPVHLPIGLSFYTFHAISYLIDVHRGQARVQRNPVTLGLYFALFPQLILGPIVRYRRIEKALAERATTLQDAASGVSRFIVGLGKKVLIADILADPVNRIFDLPASGVTPALAWLAVVAFSLQIYFDFSAYSDMAIGLARMFGFRFPENFNYPYISRSRSEVFQRFHMTFFAWMRDYLYRPLVPEGSGPWRQNLAILAVFACSGFWHGATGTFIAWGLVNGGFVVLERAWLGKYLSGWWPPLRHAYVLAVSVLMSPFFRATSFGQSVRMLGAMGGWGESSSAALPVAYYVTAPVLLALIAGIAGSAPTVPWLGRRLGMERIGETAVGAWLSPALLCGVFLLSLLAVASHTHVPFIYFQF